MITLVFSEAQAKKLGGCYEVMVDDVPTKFTTCYFTAADGRTASANDEKRMSSSLSSVDLSIWPGGLEEIRKTFSDAVVIGEVAHPRSVKMPDDKVDNRGVKPIDRGVVLPSVGRYWFGSPPAQDAA